MLYESKITKFIFYSGLSDYWKIVNSDLYNHESVFVCEGINNKILNKMSKLHNSWELNKKKELPFKNIWFSHYSAAKHLNSEIKQYAIFPESNPLSFSKKYLQFLRKKYPKLVIFFSFSNPCGDYNLGKVESVSQYYDHIITFNEADSMKYGFEQLQISGYSRIDVPDSTISESDLFFIGQNKGRLPIILNIYDRMTSLGLRCDFYVVNVNEKDIIHRSGIVYNKRLSYLEVLQHVNKTKCVLELLEGSCDYCSIRTFEALTYHKKLITMSSSILKSSFYSPSQMLFFTEPADIMNHFFMIPIENEYDISSYSPVRGLPEIEKQNRTKP